ncbi:LADA_0C12486g1_1 [Lachancea dasiensis]|uniref:LADA_0C12486g1_1 n=1 Tax=Lachancea dasiensis TaxID=1072105 RepID=A0A1G4J1T4_9SACH|nr:LADA_0C12486g1_1 [Lachancea dasiensis]
MEMWASTREYFKGWLGSGQDQRKREHGSLDNWRRRQEYAEGSGISANRASHRIRKPQASRRPTKSWRNDSKTAAQLSQGIWNTVKGVFSTRDQDLQQMKTAYADFKLQDLAEKTSRTRAQVQRRIATSAALKRKVLEKKYDEKLLHELRRGRSPERKVGLRTKRSRNMETDKFVILQHKFDSLASKVTSLENELQLARKKLMFAREKNALLESLLNDANIDDEYVKSRRRISNLQRADLKPEPGALPPSPKRALSPLYTSSPARLPNFKFDVPGIDAVHDVDKDARFGDPGLGEGDPLSGFYEKYPKIPGTELLKKDPETSLSPIRLDLSRYSNTRDAPDN